MTLHRVLVGGTASGKKLLAAELFRRHGTPVLSMDSMKVYRGMDIGTDKPGPALRADVPFELLDLVGHDESFSAGRWADAARAAVERAPAEVLFAGGTPFYLRLLLRGLFRGPAADPELRTALDALWEQRGESVVRAELAQVDPDAERRLLPGDRKRLLRALEVHRLTGRALTTWQREHTERPVPGDFVVAALRHDTSSHQTRILARVERMVQDGLLEEVATLAGRAPFAPEPGRAIGYAEALEHLAGRLPLPAMIERIAVRTRQLVRKQRIFLATFPEVRWVDVTPELPWEDQVDLVERALEWS